MSNQTETAASPAAQKQALLEAFDTVLKQQAEAREAELREAEARRRAQRRVRPTIAAAAVLSLVLCAYLYIERPEWIFPHGRRSGVGRDQGGQPPHRHGQRGAARRALPPAHRDRFHAA